MTDESKFHGAAFYSDDKHAETLSLESADEVVHNALSAARQAYAPTKGTWTEEAWMHAVDYHDPLIVYAFNRIEANLGCYSDALVDRLIELLDEDEEYSGPNGKHQWDSIDRELLSEQLAQVLAKHDNSVEPYACEVVAQKEYSREELIAILQESGDLPATGEVP